jgi:3(or 17)beta-hydroxysteroid dehydrogenase
MSEGRLQGKVAVVTGGASGIGAATVKRFRAEGAQVVIADVQADLGNKLAAETGTIFQQLDVTSEAQWAALMTMVEKRFGRLDIMFNNAGILSLGKTIENMDAATWNRVVGINQTGVMLGCQYAIALMRRNPGGSSGSIINTASTTSYAALAEDLAYCTTKAAVRILTKSVGTGVNGRPCTDHAGLEQHDAQRSYGPTGRSCRTGDFSRLG